MNDLIDLDSYYSIGEVVDLLFIDQGFSNPEYFMAIGLPLVDPKTRPHEVFSIVLTEFLVAKASNILLAHFKSLGDKFPAKLIFACIKNTVSTLNEEDEKKMLMKCIEQDIDPDFEVYDKQVSTHRYSKLIDALKSRSRLPETLDECTPLLQIGDIPVDNGIFTRLYKLEFDEWLKKVVGTIQSNSKSLDYFSNGEPNVERLPEEIRSLSLDVHMTKAMDVAIHKKMLELSKTRKLRPPEEKNRELREHLKEEFETFIYNEGRTSKSKFKDFMERRGYGILKQYGFNKDYFSEKTLKSWLSRGRRKKIVAATNKT